MSPGQGPSVLSRGSAPGSTVRDGKRVWRRAGGVFGTEDLSVILNSGLPHPVSPASGDLPQYLRGEEIGRRGLGVRVRTLGCVCRLLSAIMWERKQVL